MKIKFLMLVVLCLSAATISSAQRNVPNPIVGTFQSARVVHRVKYNDKWWMVVYVNFKIKNALSNPCKMYAYFYNDADGKPLKGGKDARYRTTGGFVTAAADFTPGHTDATYTEFKIYVPYEALNLESKPGNLFNLKYYLSMYDDDAKAEIAKSSWYKFSLKY